jgi:ATP-binding cassette, subfamily C, bacterial
MVGSLLRHAGWRLAALVALALALTATSGVGLLLLIPLLALAGLDVGQGSVEGVVEVVAAWLAAVGLAPTLPVVLVTYVLVVALTALLQHAHTVHTARLEQGYVIELRRRLYAAIARAEWVFLAARKSSDFTHALTHEIDRVGGATTALLSLLVRSLLAILYVSLALFVAPGASLLVILFGGLLALVLLPVTRAGRARGEAISRAYAGYYGVIGEHLAGLRFSKSHGADDMLFGRFLDRSAAAARAILGVVRNQAALSMWLQVGSAAIMGVVFYVALAVLGLPLATILLLLYLFARLVPMMTGVQRQAQHVLNLLPAYGRVAGMVDECEAVAEDAGGDAEAVTFERELRFEAVDFAYESGRPIVSGVDLVIPAGRTTALVGPSGAGKSTITDLAAGLIQPTSGGILVDDVTLAAAVAQAWRRQIGYVHQDTFLFHESVRDNLRVVNPDASDEALETALRSAAADFVFELPQGMDTVVGDRGVRLSGGERQRIALARALVRQPSLLILDEATSALDGENERLIQEAIERMGGRQTILIVAHRLATVRSADVIHVIDRGRVVESGNWETLWPLRDGAFRALCRAQGIDGTTGTAAT